MYLANFEIQRPPHSLDQAEGLRLLEGLHLQNLSNEEERKKVQERIARVCCKQDKIAHRYVTTPKTGGAFSGFGERGRFFQTFAEAVFEKFYPPSSTPPDDLIHVTCTGYTSPSAAQKIVLKRGWQKQTTVTHSYHMGCMGAVPAIRMACGFAICGKAQTDIVHTELCSLHLNSQLHTSEQLVAQSLFADGLIKYTLSLSASNLSFKILTVDEELIPHSEDKMKWECEDWGLKMTLSKEIPILIGREIKAFVEKLEKKCGHSLKDAIYAVHPGGPKIIEMIGKKLALSEKQLSASQEILYTCGNMSSATLPHIWEKILNDSNIPLGTLIVGLAFGPGLCMSGVILQKVGL